MNKFWKRTVREDYPHWMNMELTGEGTFHRKVGDIPNITPANDVFVFVDGYLTIENPSKPYRPNWAG